MSPLRTFSTTLVVCAALWAGSPAALLGQQLDCDDLVSYVTKTFLEPNWDDLEGLQSGLADIAEELRDAMLWYSAQELSELTEAEIKEDAEYLKLLKECMPRIAKVLENIRIRIDALEQLGSASTTANPGRRAAARMRLIDQLEQEHAETADALEEALRRAGIGATP